MIDLWVVAYSGWFVRVICWKCDVKFKYSSFIWRLIWTADFCWPLKQIIRLQSKPSKQAFKEKLTIFICSSKRLQKRVIFQIFIFDYMQKSLTIFLGVSRFQLSIPPILSLDCNITQKKTLFLWQKPHPLLKNKKGLGYLNRGNKGVVPCESEPCV